MNARQKNVLNKSVEIFGITKVRRALHGMIKQGGGSVSGGGQCLYRSTGGKKCFIGWMIPDSKYDKKWDQSTEGRSDLREINEVLNLKLERPLATLSSIQRVLHDRLALRYGENPIPFWQECLQYLKEKK